jgi:hypothetical protein
MPGIKIHLRYKVGNKLGSSLHKEMQTPRAAAVAGILFSVLLATTMVLLHLSVPPGMPQRQEWFVKNTGIVKFALNLVPFAGIAFLWFIGVLRDRLGAAEDRFFATVFWSSGILFLAMVFVSTAVAGATVIGLASDPALLGGTGVYAFGQAISAQIMNVFSLRMAAVFMISTASLGIRTRFLPRWIALLGYVLSALLLASSHFVDWLPLAFPLWILAISVFILVDNLRKTRPGGAV